MANQISSSGSREQVEQDLQGVNVKVRRAVFATIDALGVPGHFNVSVTLTERAGPLVDTLPQVSVQKALDAEALEGR